MPSDETGTRGTRGTRGTQQENLGYLRLWRDDLRQIVDQVRSLPGVRIDLEADNIRLDDVETELPHLGDRLSYFTLKAYREKQATGANDLGAAYTIASDGLAPAEVLSLRLTEGGGCTLSTNSPGPEVRRVIGAIEDIARQRRRVPMWFPRVSRHPEDSADRWGTIVFAILLAYLFAVLFVRVGFGPESAAPAPRQSIFPKPLTIGTTIPAALILLFIIISSIMSRTILRTSRRADLR
jgi:hypothetical protein